RFQAWSDQLAHVVFAAEVASADAEAAVHAAEEFAEYFDALIAERRRKPGDDVISALLDRSGESGPADAELVGACTLLLFAGHETTAGLLANATCVLFDDDEARHVLAGHPDLWSSAV